jgi:hypothetical protein
MTPAYIGSAVDLKPGPSFGRMFDGQIHWTKSNLGLDLVANSGPVEYELIGRGWTQGQRPLIAV